MPEFNISERNFCEIEEILRKTAGISLADGAQKLIIARLSKHLKRLNFQSFDDYIDLIKSSSGSYERQIMVNSLTTNTTHFFREKGHFDLLESCFMKRLILKAKAGKRVRLWSAACSSGEEAYSIAGTVIHLFPEVHNYDFRILATDINREMLLKAEIGLYDKSSISGVSSDIFRIMFDEHAENGKFSVKKGLRDLVSFRYMNFMERWPVRGPFDVIFCRNVAIYMDADTQMRIWIGLEKVLDEEGALFIGHSERIGPSLSDRLVLFGPTSFCRPSFCPIPETFPMEQ